MGLKMISAASLIPLLLLIGGGPSLAQEADVKAAIEVYHSALESLDAAKMDPLWVHDASVMLVNPADKSIAIGWNAAKKSWETALNAISELKLTQTDGPHIQVKGDVAWSTGLVSADAKLKSADSQQSNLRDGRLRKTRRALAARLAYRFAGA